MSAFSIRNIQQGINTQQVLNGIFEDRFGTCCYDFVPFKELSSRDKIRRPGEACTVFLFLCRIQNLLLILHPNFFIPPTSKSKIQNPQNPKSKIPKIQNPKSKIPKTPKIQNSKSPNLASHKDLLHNGPKSKIQNPHNPKSPKPPKSKIQNPQNPKSKIQNPKSKIPKIQNPKSKIPEIWGHKKICYITVQNPKSPKSAKKVWIWDFGLGDFGFWISARKSKIQNPKSPKSKIQNPKSPRSKIQNPQNPKSKIFRQNPKFGALGASHKELLHNDPKSKIQNPQNADIGDFGFWIWGILDFEL